MIQSITAENLTSHGVAAEDAQALLKSLRNLPNRSPEEDWRIISHAILSPRYPFALHQFLFATVFSRWDHRKGPPPAWTPTPESIRSTNVAGFMKRRLVADLPALHAWSVRFRAPFWITMLGELGIRFRQKWERVLDVTPGVT